MTTIISGDTGISQVQDGTVTSAKISNGSVTSADLDATNKLAQCKAWVEFVGTGTIGTNLTITSSFNVASVYKNAACDYTITFTTAMTDANYLILGATAGSTTPSYPMAVHSKGSATKLASSCRVWALTLAANGIGNLADSADVSVAFFGN